MIPLSVLIFAFVNNLFLNLCGTQLAQHQIGQNAGIAEAAETARRVLITLSAIRQDAAKSAQTEQIQGKRVFKTTTCPRSSLHWRTTLPEASPTTTAARKVLFCHLKKPHLFLDTPNTAWLRSLEGLHDFEAYF